MRAVVQRVANCTVYVAEKETGFINTGLLVYLGVEKNDCHKDLEYMVDKITNLRIFEDSNGKMNRSIIEIYGEILVISQFTICADARKGRRPSYSNAATPEIAQNIYLDFIDLIKKKDIKVASGIFGAMMHVEYTNVGPVTILLDSNKLF